MRIRNTLLLLTLTSVMVMAGCSKDAPNTPTSPSGVPVAPVTQQPVDSTADGLTVSVPQQNIPVEQGSSVTVTVDVETATDDTVDITVLGTAENVDGISYGTDDTTESPIPVEIAVAPDADVGDRTLVIHVETETESIDREITVVVEPPTVAITPPVVTPPVVAPPVTPTPSDPIIGGDTDVYLLIGQSNMVGSPEDNSRKDFENGDDATNPNILKLNVTENLDREFITRDDYTAVANNVLNPGLVVAHDPLHQPGNGNGQIGLGLTFAKESFSDRKKKVVLVPAAWSASSFCETSNGTSTSQWNATATSEAFLGDNLLYERALVRTREALRLSGGTLRGILWHQGESDSNNADCARTYGANLTKMVIALRAQLGNVPFVAGTMSMGTGYAPFGPNKSLVDGAHRNIGKLLPKADFVNNDDLIPTNGYPCGIRGDCIHFGAEALREMGRRYYQAIKKLNG